MNRRWAGLLLALFLVADVAVLWFVFFGRVDRPQPPLVSVEVNNKANHRKKNAHHSDAIVGPLFLVGAADGSVLRLTDGGCEGKPAEVWVGVGEEGSLTKVEVPGLRRALSAQPKAPGWSIIGADESCQVREWVSTTNDGTSWTVTEKIDESRWYRHPTNAYAIQGPGGGSELDGTCEVLQVRQLAADGYVLCGNGSIVKVQKAGRRAKLTASAVSLGATGFEVSAEGLFATLGRISGCDAQVSLPSSGVASEPYCFGNGKAPLGITLAGDLAVAQVGHDLWQRDKRGDWVKRPDSDS